MSECIEWAGAKTKGGYGLTRSSGKLVYVHRKAYAEHHGVTLTRDQHICHTCDNPACYRIEHLFLGSHADNMADMARKGRAAHGMRLPQTKLTDEQVSEVRSMKAAGVVQRRIAEHFGVSEMTVSNIVNNHRRQRVGSI